MQNRTVTVSRFHASQLPQPLPQYYTMIGRGTADDEDADLPGKNLLYSVCHCLMESNAFLLIRFHLVLPCTG